MFNTLPFGFQARHHLAAATHIIEEFESKMYKPEMTEDERKSIEDVFKHRSADVVRCWVKYGLNLLSDSRERLLQEDGDLPGLFFNS